MDRQRIDKWLWHARVVRTRKAAAALAGGGHVRVNGERIDAPARAVKPGDVVTIALDRVRILKVRRFSERRGSASEAGLLFEDLQPFVPSDAATSVGAIQTSGLVRERGVVRERGTGRPTKRDRRAIDRLLKF